MRFINSQSVCNMFYLCLIIFVSFTYSLRSFHLRNKSQYKLKALSLFRNNPQMRKIAIAYLHHKVINNPINENTYDEYLVYNNRDIIKNIFQNVIPPVKLQLSELNNEIDNTLELFEQQSSIEEHEFSSKILLDNSIWENVGETVIKEMIYIDNSYEGYFQTQSYLCNTCTDQLMVNILYIINIYNINIIKTFKLDNYIINIIN